MKGILRGLTEHHAATDPSALDERLRGRTYAIPFEDVWQACLGLAGGGLRGWSIVNADDRDGRLEVVWRGGLTRAESDVVVHVGLDRNAQTRVDLTVSSRKARGDLGRGRRLVGRFLVRLDKRLEAVPAQILDPLTLSAYQVDS